MFDLTMHSTHFILRLYGVTHMVKDHSDCERGNPLLPHRLLFPISSKGSLYASSHRQDTTYHSLCNTCHGALAGMRNGSMGSPHEGSIRRPIAHVSERSYHGATSCSKSGNWDLIPFPHRSSFIRFTDVYTHTFMKTSTTTKTRPPSPPPHKNNGPASILNQIQNNQG